MNLNLELTDHCNLRCRMCSQSMREEAHGAPMRFMSFEAWRRALQGLAGLRAAGEAIHLCPHWLGEPTLHPQFDLFAEYAFAVNRDNRLFSTFKLHTNAIILSEARARRLIRLAHDPHQAPDTFRAIHFSIDAHRPETYRWIKGADHRDRVYRNLERFLQIRDALGLRRPVAHVAFVVQAGNAREDDLREVTAFVQHWQARLPEARVYADWPPFDEDAIYLRRWNTADQAGADRLHAAACRAAGLIPADRLPGSF